MRMPRQKIGNRTLQDSHAMAVNDTNAVDFGERRAVQQFIHLMAGFFGALADEIDLAEEPSKLGP